MTRAALLFGVLAALAAVGCAKVRHADEHRLTITSLKRVALDGDFIFQVKSSAAEGQESTRQRYHWRVEWVGGRRPSRGDGKTPEIHRMKVEGVRGTAVLRVYLDDSDLGRVPVAESAFEVF